MPARKKRKRKDDAVFTKDTRNNVRNVPFVRSLNFVGVTVTVSRVAFATSFFIPNVCG